MKRKQILIVCNTYYQLIMALRMNETLFAQDSVHVILTDRAPNAAKVSENIKQMAIFETIHYIETAAYCQKRDTAIEKARDILELVFGSRKFRDITDRFVDKFLYYNDDLFEEVVFACLYQKNKQLQGAKFEEGILSYNYLPKKNMKFACGNVLRKLIGKDNLQVRTTVFYCCHPDAYYGEKQTVTIPCIDKSSGVRDVLANAFGITEQLLDYKEKYIYFSSVYDFEGGLPIGELDAVKKIADVVGIDNLLIKKHPRDQRNAWCEAGFHVDRNSGLPWEAIQFAMDCADKVFITANSGSVLSVNMLLDPMPRVVFVYPCCDLSGNPTAQSTIDTIEKLLDNPKIKNMLTNVVKVKSAEEINAQ